PLERHVKQAKPILHARDHLPGGADPIPGLCTDCHAPPVTTTIPGEGAVDTAAGRSWHWWRFRRTTMPSFDRHIDDEGAGPRAPVDIAVIAHSPLDFNTEFVLAQPGPVAESLSMQRTGVHTHSLVDWWAGS